MALSTGTYLGSYEILGRLGAGGMGEVYRARDAKLARDVAIKILPDDFAADAERLARFRREAQVLAALNHTNIGAIYDLQKSANTHFLVLELVEGETLAERVSRGAIPADEAVEIAQQIAEALQVAHEKGIVHRDLKPANIKITPEGKVKVLDFGLAKIHEIQPSGASPSHSPTLMAASTEGGVILGTLFYMSPEQARGRAVTKQTDIWAFGCVLFEMLTGRMAFSGETVSDTIAKILKEEPEWSSVSSVAPGALRRIVERCLQKDMRRRFHDAGDLRFELEEILTPAALPVTPKALSRRRGALIGALAVFLIVVVLAANAWFRHAVPATVWSGTLLGGPDIAFGPRVSPDGKMIAFQALVDGQTQVAVMNPKSGNWTILTHEKNQGQIVVLCWSADGTKIYFDLADGPPFGVFSIPALGGEQRLLIEDADIEDALADGSLIIARTNSDRRPQLYRFKPNTGEIQPLNAVATYRMARAFPDGKQIVFFGKPADSSGTAPGLYILDLHSNVPRPIGPKLDLSSIFGLAINPVDQSVLLDAKNGDLHQIISIPSDGRTPARDLLALTGQTYFMDAAADGSLYVDQVARTVQALRFKESAQLPEQMNTVPEGSLPILELPDGRILLTGFFNGRSRLLVTRSNGELVPFVDTDEETRGPVTFAGPGQVAFVLGRPPQQSIAVTSIKDSRLIRRISITAADSIQSLTASSDGNTLFYANAGSIWSIPSTGGDPRNLGPGDSVAFDSAHQSLIVEYPEKDGGQLERMPVTGGPAQTIPTMNGELRMTGLLGPNAVRADGRIVVTVTSRDSWFFGNAVVNPEKCRGLECVRHE